MLPFRISGMLLLIMWLIPNTGRSQVGDCKRLVLEAYQKFNQRYDFGASMPSAHMKMTVETTYKSTGRTKPRSTVQHLAAEVQGEYLHFTDGTTEAYLSPGEMVVISYDKKMVSITNAVMPRQSEYVPSMMKMRTGIIQSAIVESCSFVTEAGHSYRRVVLLPQKISQLAAVQKLIVTLDEKTMALFRLNIIYRSSQPVSQVAYTLLEEEPNAKDFTLKPAFDYVLVTNTKLRAKYSGYQLIDQRKH